MVGSREKLHGELAGGRLLYYVRTLLITNFPRKNINFTIFSIASS